MPTPTRRILIADDEKDICSRLQEELTTEGYSVVTVYDGKKAQDLLRQTAFDLAIIDIVMPGIDGIAVLKSLKKESPSTKVIMLTGYPNVNHAIESKKYGAEEFIPKPFNIDELKLTIKNLLAD